MTKGNGKPQVDLAAVPFDDDTFAKVQQLAPLQVEVAGRTVADLEREVLDAVEDAYGHLGKDRRLLVVPSWGRGLESNPENRLEAGSGEYIRQARKLRGYATADVWLLNLEEGA